MCVVIPPTASRVSDVCCGRPLPEAAAYRSFELLRTMPDHSKELVRLLCESVLSGGLQKVVFSGPQDATETDSSRRCATGRNPRRSTVSVHVADRNSADSPESGCRCGRCRIHATVPARLSQRPAGDRFCHQRSPHVKKGSLVPEVEGDFGGCENG